LQAAPPHSPRPPPIACYRLKGSLRRCDVRSADDYNEDEYREATQTLGSTALDIVKVGEIWRDLA